MRPRLLRGLDGESDAGDLANIRLAQRMLASIPGSPRCCATLALGIARHRYRFR